MDDVVARFASRIVTDGMCKFYEVSYLDEAYSLAIIMNYLTTNSLNNIIQGKARFDTKFTSLCTNVIESENDKMLEALKEIRRKKYSTIRASTKGVRYLPIMSVAPTMNIQTELYRP